MTKTKKIVLWSVVGIVLTTAAILGTIYDLQISKSLAQINDYNYLSTSFFGILGETIGENILYVLLVSAFAILFFFLLKKPLSKKWLNYILLSLFALASLVVCFYCINKTLEYIALHTSFGLDEFMESTLGLIVVILFSVCVDICAFILFNKLSLETLSHLWKWAVFVMFVAAISNGIVQGAKHIFDRTRYRAMVFVGDTDFSFYTPWYQINTNKFHSVSAFADDFFKSFPSGHTCAAASSFALIALPTFLNKINTKKWNIILWSTAIVYTIFVGLSRIVAGAHFFMDVFVGGMITFATTMILLAIYKKFIQPKLNQNTNLNEKK